MTSVKAFSLTSENLKKFEKELQQQNRKRQSLQRNINPERTEADGRSSGIHSYGSQLSAFKESLNDNSKHADTKKVLNSNSYPQGHRKSSYSLERPQREAFRRNPEGQSRNESSQATPHVVRIDYEEGSVRIDYDSDGERGKQGIDSEEEEEEASDDDDDDDDESDEESDESDEESDESDEQSDDDDDETETTPKRASGTPTTVRTHYTSSINASVSSIPTVASVKRRESTNTIQTTKTARKGSAQSNVSSAPSYILNTNQYRMKKMAAKKEKEREKVGGEVTESELSFGPSHRSFASAMSMREKGTSSVQSNGSYVATRNWSRWSNYSGVGYSISEGPETNHRSRKPATKETTVPNKRVKTPRLRSHSRSQEPHLPVIGKNNFIKSVPDLRKSGKRHVTLTLDPGLSRARPVSRCQIASRMSTRSIIKRPTTSRVKSLPDLNKQAIVSYFQMERGINRSGSRSGLRKKSAKAAKPSNNRRDIRLRETDIDDDIDFTNRRKRVRKLKERPQRQRNETILSSASSARSNLHKRNKTINERDSSMSSGLSMSSLKSSQSKQSGKPASSSASSKASLASRKARLQPLRTYAGYRSGRDNMSSGASLLAPGTPISLILQRSPSLRSVITEYSSYLSLAASSAKSARASSRSSLSSTGKYQYFFS